MQLTTRVGLLAGATAMTLTGMSAAATTDANADELRAQINKLNARVAELEGDNWLTEQRSEEIRGLVNDVLADADTRASLLGSGMQAGYDDGFTIGSSDGNFQLRLNGQAQFRWIYNNQDDSSGDSHRSGFENTRTKLWFTGHVVNPQWQYTIEGDFGGGNDWDDRTNGEFDLLDAYINYDYGNGMSVTAGQFKLPLLREELIDSRYQQLVERSLVNSYFTAGRSQGIMFNWEQDTFRLSGAWSDGGIQENTDALMMDTEWSITGRAEMLLGGTWDQFEDFRSAPGEENGLLLGLAAHWQDDEYGTALGGETEVVLITADVSAEFGGFNLFGAYVFSGTDTKGGGNTDSHAVIAQGGFHLTDEWEIFGRYEHVFWDEDISDDDHSIFTTGVNRYFAGHNAKFTADVGYGFEQVFGDNLTGWRTDAVDDDGQFVVRTQLQLLF